MSATPDLPVSGTLHVQVAEDCTLDGGEWHLTTDQHGAPTAQISPPAVPMFQQVVEYLEAKPVPPGGNVRRADEARAAVAVCLRWGSYFAVLTDPSKPNAPNIDDDQVRQIDDEEMARMNIEISAGVAWWLTLASSDGRRYEDLVARALTYLPTGRKTVSALLGESALLAATMPEMAAALQRQWPADRLERDMQTAADHGIRVIANTITLHAWRNGPIETVHAGRYVGYGLNERRVLPKAEKSIIRHAQNGLYSGLKAADYLKYDGAWPPPAERVLPFMHGLIGPTGWSCTELSHIVELPLRCGVP
ncbi:MAG: hypothetical protein WCB27_22030, partial [Thermoguttaceae bacterium]